MTLYKFNKLSLTQQLLVLELKSARLDVRNEGHYHIALFQIDAFYVEAYFPKESIRIEKLRAFTGTSKLKPYLERIDLHQLLK